MRSLGEADWYGYRAPAPLTGREPVLGRLRNRLRRRGTGWGWVTVTGPWGSGVTRVLQEAALIVAEDNAPPPLWIRPAPEGCEPLEPLRCALRTRLPAQGVPEGARFLRALLHRSSAEIDTLACWLFGGVGARCDARPVPAVIRLLLERLVPCGPLIVDEYDRLHEDVRAILVPSAEHNGPGVIAGISADTTVAPEGTLWALDPLSESQVELMLKRWLRHVATARRLAPDMHKRYGGWPGRIVEAVRTLARAGNLVREPRGIILKRPPRQWPDGRRPCDAFFRFAKALGAPAQRVLELVAVQGEPADCGVIAEAAGVKRSFVDGLSAEAAAACDDVHAGTFFASADERDAFLDDMVAAHQLRVAARLAEAWDETPPSEEPGCTQLLRRCLALSRADRRTDALAVLQQALDVIQPNDGVEREDLNRLVEIADRVGPAGDESERALFALCAQHLVRAGRIDLAQELLPVAGDAQPTLREVLVRADLHARAGRIDEALALLESVLRPEMTDTGPEPFDAWELLAVLYTRAGDTDGARRAWRGAGRSLAPSDVRRRARFHRGAASCAAHVGRTRAVGAHMRRAAKMFESCGLVRDAASAWGTVGDIEPALGNARSAQGCILTAAAGYSLLGDAEDEARVRYSLGIAHIRLYGYDRAAEQLERVLRIVKDNNLHLMRPRVHVALAVAYRGQGDLALEREHASRAAALRGSARVRVRAAAMLAEADLRAGAPGALRLLERAERDLRAAGLDVDADVARAVLFDARLRAGNVEDAQRTLDGSRTVPTARLGRARLDLATGKPPGNASSTLEQLGADVSLSADLRALAYAHLADAHRRQEKLVEARESAVAAAALMEVRDRGHMDDLRIHRILARVFQRVGETGRAVGHRFAARRQLRALIRAASDPREGRRLARAQWRVDPGMRDNTTALSLGVA